MSADRRTDELHIVHSATVSTPSHAVGVHAGRRETDQHTTLVNVSNRIGGQTQTDRQTDNANRHLLAVPRFPLNTYGRRAFSVTGPTAWNSLPDFIRAPTSSTDCCRRLLKTYLSYCFVSSGRLHSIWHRRVVLLGSAESTTLSLAARYQWLPRRRRISATADGAAAEPGRRDVIALRHHYL